MQNKNKPPFFLWALIGAFFVLPAVFQPVYALPDFMKKFFGNSEAPLKTERLVDKLNQQSKAAPVYRLQPRIIIQPTTKAKTYRLTPLPVAKPKPAVPAPIPQSTLRSVVTPRAYSVPVDVQPQVQAKIPAPQNRGPVAPTSKALLGTQEFHMGGIKALPKWTRVLNGIAQDKPTVERCHNNGQCASRNLEKWQDFVKSQRGLDIKTQLENLNRYANRFPYVTDQRRWGKSDYWATPLEFLQRSGDCEDYVILKYTTLRQLGVPAENLRLVVVKDTVRNLAHAVLAVYDGPNIYILDSLFDAVLSHEQVLQYIPYYSVNENSRWAHIKPLNKR